MSRPVKNARTRSTPGGPKIPSAKGTVGRPETFGVKANPGAGKFLDRGRPMFEGPSQILKDNRGG